MNEVSLFMIFMDKNKKIIKEAKLVTTVPDEREYSQYLGKVNWVSDNQAVLITKKGSELKGFV